MSEIYSTDNNGDDDGDGFHSEIVAKWLHVAPDDWPDGVLHEAHCITRRLKHGPLLLRFAGNFTNDPARQDAENLAIDLLFYRQAVHIRCVNGNTILRAVKWRQM